MRSLCLNGGFNVYEFWKWIGVNAPQLAIVLAFITLFSTALIYIKRRWDKRALINEELGKHLKELLELHASTSKFISIMDDDIRKYSNLTDYRPNIFYLSY